MKKNILVLLFWVLTFNLSASGSPEFSTAVFMNYPIPAVRSIP